MTLLPPLPYFTVPPYNDCDTLLRCFLDMIPTTGVPNDFCSARVTPLPHFPSTIRFALAFDLDGLEDDLPPVRLLTSLRTLSYCDLLIPRDLRLLACPLPCFPAITSSAILEIALDGFLPGLDGLEGLLLDEQRPPFLPRYLRIPST